MNAIATDLNQHDRTRSNGTASVAAHQTANALDLLREWGKVFTLTATHCACCGKDLRDSVSVTMGIGPDCASHHYNIPFDITDEMVMAALGRLAQSKLDSKLKVAVRDLKDKPRDLCNVLVWWASVHLNEVDTVLACAEIVSLLGFVSLGDRLRERNTNVIISKDDDTYIVRCRSKANTIRNMARIKEAVKVSREGRFKYGWKFPSSVKALVWTILGEDFGDEWATVPSKDGGPSQIIKIDPATRWDVVRAFRNYYNPPAPVTQIVAPPPAPAPTSIVRVTSTAVEVHTPGRNFAFIADLKLLPAKERRWDPDNHCWRVLPKHEAKVRELVAKHFNGAV